MASTWDTEAQSKRTTRRRQSQASRDSGRVVVLVLQLVPSPTTAGKPVYLSRLVALSETDFIQQTTFYVTESSAFRNRILYFRQDDWNTLCAPLIDRLSSDTFVKIDKVTDIQTLWRLCLKSVTGRS
jgi:Telomerase ribonucleoprotein complex - RNA binding domain